MEFSLETASLYAQDPHNNRYGFKCLVVGYDNPTAVSTPYHLSLSILFNLLSLSLCLAQINASNSCLIRLEQELSYLGGMCSANLMKKDLNLPGELEIAKQNLYRKLIH